MGAGNYRGSRVCAKRVTEIDLLLEFEPQADMTPLQAAVERAVGEPTRVRALKLKRTIAYLRGYSRGP